MLKLIVGLLITAGILYFLRRSTTGANNKKAPLKAKIKKHNRGSDFKKGKKKKKEKNKKKIDENFINELKSIGSKFEQKIHDSKKVHDLDYWYNFIQTRAKTDTNKFTQTSPELSIDSGYSGSLEDVMKHASLYTSEREEYHEKVAKLIWGHADEYNKRLNDPNGDPYNNGYKFNDDEKIDFLKERITSYGLIFKYLSNLNSEISSVMIKYELHNPLLEIVRLELAHAKGAVYGAIKYAQNIGVSNSIISEWYPDFINDKKLIKGKNPFNSLFENNNNKTTSDRKEVPQDDNKTKESANKVGNVRPKLLPLIEMFEQPKSAPKLDINASPASFFEDAIGQINHYDTYEMRLAGGAKVPPSLTDTLICDICTLTASDDNFDINQITIHNIKHAFDKYLNLSSDNIPGYRPEVHSNFIKQFQADELEFLANEILEYIHLNGVRDVD